MNEDIVRIPEESEDEEYAECEQVNNEETEWGEIANITDSK